MYGDGEHLDEAIKKIKLGLNQSTLRQNFRLLDLHRQLLQKKQKTHQGKKLLINFNLVYPNGYNDQGEPASGEYSFEEIKAKVYYKAYDGIRPNLEKETRKYIDEINDLKLKYK